MISSNWAKAGALSANSEVDTARAVKPLKVRDDICVSPCVISGIFAAIVQTLLYFKKVRNGILSRKMQKNARFNQIMV
jgi:hypothetical protein